MKEKLYIAIVKHLSNHFGVDSNIFLEDMPLLNISNRYTINVEELTIGDRVFYVRDGRVYKSLCNLDSKESIAQEVGYLKDSIIYLK